jgi:hypothetical protein
MAPISSTIPVNISSTFSAFYDFDYFPAGSLPDHYRFSADLLPDHYRFSADLLPDHCRISAGLLPDLYRFSFDHNRLFSGLLHAAIGLQLSLDQEVHAKPSDGGIFQHKCLRGIRNPLAGDGSHGRGAAKELR